MQPLMHSPPLTLQQATADPCLCWRLPDTHRQVWVSLLWGPLLLSSGSWCTQGFVSALQESVSPVLCKFWRLYCGVNCDHLQKGLCLTQVCCTQSPCPCGRSLLIHTSTGDTQTLNGRSGSGSVGFPSVQKIWFEPSEHPRQAQGLTLNMILPLLLSCWGYSFAFGYGYLCVCVCVGSNILLSMVVQQQVVILVFLQEKMNAHASTQPSCKHLFLIQKELQNIYTHSFFEVAVSI